MSARPHLPASRALARAPRSRRSVFIAVLTVVLGVGGSLVTAGQFSGAAAAPSLSPYGYASVAQVPGGAWLSGWAIDPSSPRKSVKAYALVDGHRAGRVTLAKGYRPDVARNHRSAGSRHGFRIRLSVSEGRHTVCATAVNIGRGANRRIRCITRTFDYGPQGRVDYVRAGHGGLSIKGWAVDADSYTSAVRTTVTIDGHARTVLANTATTEVPKSWPTHGTRHGFSLFLPTSQGSHRVCVTARDIGYGADNSFGCRTVVLDERPTYGMNFVGQQSGKLRVRGWTYDVDKPTTPLSLVVTIDGHPSSMTANGLRSDVNAVHPGVGNYHGFDFSRTLTEGLHTVRIVAHNLDLGSDRVLVSRSVRLNFTPSASLVTAEVRGDQIWAQGWAVDPDTSRGIGVQFWVDGKLVKTDIADNAGPKNGKFPGRNFGNYLNVLSGTHTVCVVGLNTLWGTHNSASSCRKVTIAISPHGHFDTATRITGSTNIRVTGWAFDRDTASAIQVYGTVDGTTLPTIVANTARADIAKAYSGVSSAHGFSATVTTPDGEHRICLAARNVSGGANVSLGCKIVNAIHPKAPSAARTPKAVGGYGAATVSWVSPVTDGGAPVDRYVVQVYPGSHSVTVSATARSATVGGLAVKGHYYARVYAHNVAGYSAYVNSAWFYTLAGPAPQRSMPPVATSRYIRNIRGSSSAELATMRAEGAADASRNVSNHRYLVLLDIGGQDYSDGGIVLSATTRFVSNANLVRDVNAYVDGYRSKMHGVAPVTIALGTNNDMDVSYSSGRQWAQSVVNPVAAHAAGFSGISIAGANDIEPGFRAGYTATRSWLSGYLAGTSRPFIFNGSADGCAWTTTGRGCNNGWTMAGLYQLAGGASSSRIVNLPQIYNTTMAGQWKYISLTGVVGRHPRINFGGPLTELTACQQSGGCGSMSANSAWATLWGKLQSDTRLRQTSLPYATDLRVDW